MTQQIQHSTLPRWGKVGFEPGSCALQAGPLPPNHLGGWSREGRGGGGGGRRRGWVENDSAAGTARIRFHVGESGVRIRVSCSQAGPLTIKPPRRLVSSGEDGRGRVGRGEGGGGEGVGVENDSLAAQHVLASTLAFDDPAFNFPVSAQPHCSLGLERGSFPLAYLQPPLTLAPHTLSLLTPRGKSSLPKA